MSCALLDSDQNQRASESPHEFTCSVLVTTKPLPTGNGLSGLLISASTTENFTYSVVPSFH